MNGIHNMVILLFVYSFMWLPGVASDAFEEKTIVVELIPGTSTTNVTIGNNVVVFSYQYKSSNDTSEGNKTIFIVATPPSGPVVWNVTMNINYICAEGENGRLSPEQFLKVEQSVLSYASEINPDINIIAANILDYENPECCADPSTCQGEPFLGRRNLRWRNSQFQFNVYAVCKYCPEEILPVENSINKNSITRHLQEGTNRLRFVEILQEQGFESVDYAEDLAQSRVNCKVGSDACDLQGLCCGIEGCICNDVSNSLCANAGCDLPNAVCCADDISVCRDTERCRCKDSQCDYQYGLTGDKFRTCCRFDFCFPSAACWCYRSECSFSGCCGSFGFNNCKDSGLCGN